MTDRAEGGRVPMRFVPGEVVVPRGYVLKNPLWRERIREVLRQLNEKADDRD